MLGIIKSKKRGDTLIEVLIAMAIFSLIAVASLSIMNQGTATSQRALEITLVRQEMNSQAETLRFLNASYDAVYQPGVTVYANAPANQWKSIKLKVSNDSSTITSLDNCNPAINPNSFVLNTRKAQFQDPASTYGIIGPAKSFSQVIYNGSDNITSVEGIWIEAVSPLTAVNNYQGNSGYIDFHIRACWNSPGMSVPVTLGTIVRLYEPRG